MQFDNIEVKSKNRGGPRCSGKVSCSCSTRGTRPVTLDTNPVISHDRWPGSVYDKWNISVVIGDKESYFCLSLIEELLEMKETTDTARFVSYLTYTSKLTIRAG